MTDPYDKRQGRLEVLLRGLLPAEESQDLKLSPEDEAFLAPLGVHALMLMNGLYRRFEGVDFAPVSEEQQLEMQRELRREIQQLDRLDKEGLLAPHWWQDYVPGVIAHRRRSRTDRCVIT